MALESTSTYQEDLPLPHQQIHNSESDMGLIVKLVGGGLGLASEAIHDYRARSRSQVEPSRSLNPQSAAPSSSRSGPSVDSDAPPEYVEVADEATAQRLVRDGTAERVVGPADEKKRSLSKAAEAGYGTDDDSTGDEDSDVGQLDDEAAWELDDMAGRLAPPSYADSVASARAAGEGESEQAKVKREEQMIRDIVRMAGPPPQSTQRIPCPVIIPQRRPRNKDRGFVRAYAPVLDSCGVSQDVFLKFQQDWLVASKVNTCPAQKLFFFFPKK